MCAHPRVHVLTLWCLGPVREHPRMGHVFFRNHSHAQRRRRGFESEYSAEFIPKAQRGEQWLGIRCRWSPEEGGGVRSLSLTNGVEGTAPRQTERPHSISCPNTDRARAHAGSSLTHPLSYSVTHSVMHSNIRTAWLCDVCNVVHAQNVTRVVASTCAVDVFSSFVVCRDGCAPSSVRSVVLCIAGRAQPLCLFLSVVHRVFVMDCDVAAAFGHVSHHEIMQSDLGHGCPTASDCGEYTNSGTVVKLDDIVTPGIRRTRSVPQGDPVAADLFGAAVDTPAACFWEMCQHKKWDCR